MAFLKQVGVPLLFLAIGVAIGLFSSSSSLRSTGNFFEEREHDSSYSFINPLLSCGEGNFNHLGNAESAQLEETLETIIDGMKSQGRITDGAIYFREMNGGPWVGVNYDAEFTPGSLLKVPLAMSVYQLSEGDPDLLKREVEFTGAGTSVAQYFKSKEPLTPGTYTVEELVRRAITHSDNNAALLLATVIGIEQVDESYERLGITVPTMGQDYSTKVRTYASFFRILYNATYLDRGNSEKLLTLLSQTKFDDGLVAGVPPGTKIAHKFGERALDGTATIQLHDCGIVYHPTQPYLLCIMMRGREFTTVAGAIADISKTVYDSVR